MNFRTHLNGPVNTNCTSMQGTIQSTLLQLTKAFGAPRAGVDGGFYEWDILFDDGQVATIYDWSRKVQPEPTELMSWHIGGLDQRASVTVHEAYRHAHLARKWARA